MDGDHYRPVLQAARAGLAVVPIPDKQAGARLANLRRPALVVIGDRPDDRPPRGPEAFDCPKLRKTLRRCHAIAIHADSQTAWDYQVFCAGAVMSGLAIVIETTPVYESAWRRYVHRHVTRPNLLTFSPTAAAARHTTPGHA